MLRLEELDLLACPDCSGESLDPLEPRAERGLVREGGLRCPRCGSVYEIGGGIPWLLPAALKGMRRQGIETHHEEWSRWGERLVDFADWRRRTWSEDSPEEKERNRLAAERRRDAFARFCGRIPGRALEVGCGDGYLSRAPGFSVEEYWGVDPMPPEEGEPEFRLVAGVGERLPFRSGAFQAVLVKDSLHHFQDPARFLDEARRVTEREGRLLVCQGVEGEADSGEAAGPAGRLGDRAAKAWHLLREGRIRELGERAGRLVTGGGAPGKDEESEEDRPWLWQLTREAIESEVSRRFRVLEALTDGNCLYLKATH